MELSSTPVEETQTCTHLGRCSHFFWLGVVFDATGAGLLFAGVFSPALYGDLLLYGGSIIIFFSLLWWVFWFTGNIELSPEEAVKDAFPAPPADLLNFLGGGFRHRFSCALGSLSATVMRLHQQRRRLRGFQRSSQSITVRARVETGRAKDAREGGQASGATPDFHRSGRPKAAAGRPSRTARSPSPRAIRTHRSLPLPPAVSPSQSLPLSRSECSAPTAFTLKSRALHTPAQASQGLGLSTPGGSPKIILRPANLSTVPLPNQPVVTLAPGSQDAFPVSSRRQSPVSVTVQSHLQVPTALAIQLQNPSQVSLNQSHHQSRHASRDQPAATQVSVAPAANPGFPQQIARPAGLHAWPLISGPVSEPPDLPELISPRDPLEPVFIKPGVSETNSFDFPDPATDQPGG